MEEKTNFLVGMICGIVLSCVVVLIGFMVMRDRLIKDLTPEYVENTEYTEFENKVVSKVRQLRNYIDKFYLYDVDETKMLDSISKGVLSSLGDPYSTYYNPEEFQKLLESTSGAYYGIGVQVSQDVKTMVTTIVNIFKNTPAEEVGMKVGDIFVEVDGHDVSGMELSEIVTYIKGEEGTKVPIKIYRQKDNKYYTFQVERRKVEVTTVSGQMLEDNIGYIVVAEFDEVTPKQFKTEYDALKKQGMKGVIIDLRANPGGLLSAVVEMCDMFLDKGDMIVYTEDKNGNRDEYTASKKPETMPMVVLVDGNSASASEIFSGAMKDHKRATLVGTKTFGKGIVQRFIPLLGEEGDAVKVTISSYFTPSGVCIHGIGITPDVVVELDEKIYDLPEVTLEDDNQLQTAITEMKKKLGK